MAYVQQMKIKPRMTVGELLEEMDKCGVLGAGKLGSGAKIIFNMFTDPEFTVFLSLAGPAVAGGLRLVIRDLVEMNYVDAIITTGANIVHDLVEALGYRHLKGTSPVNDVKLRGKGIGRIGDIYVEQKAFEALEKSAYRILDELPERRRERIAVYELVEEIGKKLKDSNSILAKAAEHNVKIFSPAFLDSMIGLNLWTYGQTNKLRVDPMLDMNKLIEIAMEAKKTGAIILGGGVPKHHVLVANILREGMDAAVQITMDRPEPGGLSGAPLEEAISWRKIRETGKFVTITGDMVTYFPLLITAVLEKIEKSKNKRS